MNISDRKYEYQTVIFALIGLSIVGQLYLPIPILMNLQQKYQIHNSSLIISAFGYSYAIGFLFFGPISDKIGKRKTMLLGMTTLSIVTFALSMIEDGRLFIIFRGIQGFFSASFPPLILAYIGQQFPEEKRGIAISSMAFSFLSAVIISQLFIIYVANASLGFAELILAVVYFFALLFLAFNIKELPIKNTQSIIKIFGSLPKVFFNTKLLIFYIYTFFVLMIFISFHLTLSINTSNFVGSDSIIKIIGLPAMLVSFQVPKLIKKLNTTSVISIAFFVQGTAMLISSLAFYTKNKPMLMLASVLIASATALLVPTLIAQISANSTIKNRGTAISLYTFILFCGASSAPILINEIKPFLNEFIILLIFSVISIILFLLNRFNRKIY